MKYSKKGKAKACAALAARGIVRLARALRAADRAAVLAALGVGGGK